MNQNNEKNVVEIKKIAHLIQSRQKKMHDQSISQYREKKIDKKPEE